MRRIALPLLGLAAGVLSAAEQVTVTATNGLDTARPSKTIAVPRADLARGLPGAEPDKIVVRDAAGRLA